jgi:hypothetical protein
MRPVAMVVRWRGLSGVPIAAARLNRRLGGDLTVIWAMHADSANAGLSRPALIIAGVTARQCAAPAGALGTPWVGVRRLRRRRLDFAKQHRTDQEKRKHWRAHRCLPSYPQPDVDPIKLHTAAPRPATARRAWLRLLSITVILDSDLHCASCSFTSRARPIPSSSGSRAMLMAIRSRYRLNVAADPAIKNNNGPRPRDHKQRDSDEVQ